VPKTFAKTLVCKREYDVALWRQNSVLPVKMTTTGHSLILEFGRGHGIKQSSRASPHLCTPPCTRWTTNYTQRSRYSLNLITAQWVICKTYVYFLSMSLQLTDLTSTWLISIFYLCRSEKSTVDLSFICRKVFKHVISNFLCWGILLATIRLQLVPELDSV